MGRSPTLLACFAHPDDESYGVAGTMARYVANGSRCTVVTATAGEAGEIFGDDIPRERLAEVRLDELAEACRIIGADAPEYLGYPDGGLTSDIHDELTSKLLKVLESVDPDAVFTFDRTGVTGHSDHIAMHHAVTRAFREWGNPGARLFYVCLPLGELRRLQGAMVPLGLEELPLPAQEWDDSGRPSPDGSDGPYFVPDSWVTHRIDISEFMDVKRAAILSHKSQIDPNGFPAALPSGFFEEVFKVECFTLAAGPSTSSPETIDG